MVFSKEQHEALQVLVASKEKIMQLLEEKQTIAAPQRFYVKQHQLPDQGGMYSANGIKAEDVQMYLNELAARCNAFAAEVKELKKTSFHLPCHYDGAGEYVLGHKISDVSTTLEELTTHLNKRCDEVNELKNKQQQQQQVIVPEHYDFKENLIREYKTDDVQCVICNLCAQLEVRHEQVSSLKNRFFDLRAAMQTVIDESV